MADLYLEKTAVEQVLGYLNPPRPALYCVGSTEGSPSCNNRIEFDEAEAVRQLYRRLPAIMDDNARLKEALERMAELCLCRRLHHSQRNEVAMHWRYAIRSNCSRLRIDRLHQTLKRERRDCDTRLADAEAAHLAVTSALTANPSTAAVESAPISETSPQSQGAPTDHQGPAFHVYGAEYLAVLAENASRGTSTSARHGDRSTRPMPACQPQERSPFSGAPVDPSAAPSPYFTTSTSAIAGPSQSTGRAPLVSRSAQSSAALSSILRSGGTARSGPPSSLLGLRPDGQQDLTDAAETSSPSVHPLMSRSEFRTRFPRLAARFYPHSSSCQHLEEVISEDELHTESLTHTASTYVDIGLASGQEQLERRYRTLATQALNASQQQGHSSRAGRHVRWAEQAGVAAPPPSTAPTTAPQPGSFSSYVDPYCALCLSLLSDPVITPCNHTYCRTCISKWLEIRPCCFRDQKRLAIADLRSAEGNVRKPVLGECVVCYEEVDARKMGKLVYCKAQCGHNLHRKCFRQWAVMQGPARVTCPVCRVRWKD